MVEINSSYALENIESFRQKAANGDIVHVRYGQNDTLVIANKSLGPLQIISVIK